MIASFSEDVIYAVRGLRRDPFLAFAATLTLAACIGANTAVFSVANSILIRSLPYPGSERIAWISERSGPAHEDIGAAPDYYRLREGNRVFDEVAAFNPITVNRTGVERPEQLDAAAVSASFFRVTGMQPTLGRYLAREEEGSHAPPVIVLSYAFWRSHLGSDPQASGRRTSAVPALLVHVNAPRGSVATSRLGGTNPQTVKSVACEFRVAGTRLHPHAVAVSPAGERPWGSRWRPARPG